jgi:hypothetical protein
MKPNTRIWIKCENVGNPADMLVMNDSARECVLAIGQWLMGVYMGQKIRIAIARSLRKNCMRIAAHPASGTMMNDLESIIGGTPEPSGENQCSTILATGYNSRIDGGTSSSFGLS